MLGAVHRKALHWKIVFKMDLWEITGLHRFILLTADNLTYNVMKCCLQIAIFVMFLDLLLPVYDKYHSRSLGRYRG